MLGIAEGVREINMGWIAVIGSRWVIYILNWDTKQHSIQAQRMALLGPLQIDVIDALTFRWRTHNMMIQHRYTQIAPVLSF